MDTFTSSYNVRVVNFSVHLDFLGIGGVRGIILGPNIDLKMQGILICGIMSLVLHTATQSHIILTKPVFFRVLSKYGQQYHTLKTSKKSL